VALVGRLVALFALFMLVPFAFAWVGRDGGETAFLLGTLVTAGAGGAMSLFARRSRHELQPRDGFLLVSLTWALLPAFGALPLLWALPDLSVTDAYFEAMSGFTATGSSVINGLERLPLSVNVWRCLLQLVGGLGIIVLVVAVLPLLGIGGTQLFRAEAAGPMKDQKLTPRIADTARGLWGVYFGMALACFIAYKWAGMGWADAFMHTCATVGLGGFSSYDAGFMHWDSPAIDAVAVLFMVLAGVNFALYFVALRSRSPRVLWRNAELRAYVATLACAVLVVTAYLQWHGTYDGLAATLRHVAFSVVSVATTTGFAHDDYALWPTFAPALMLLLGCFATCAGSTGGGLKMVRMVLLVKQVRRELVRIVHPNVVNPVVFGGAAVDPRVMQSVIAYMMVYGATLVTVGMVLVFSGLDLVTAFSAAVACLNNIGPGLGQVGPSTSYASLSDLQTWVCTLAMLLGRLELLSVLVLFTPQFWRR
ncbi:MAG TPA: potassium transporter TrkG, partial [Burkholderiaceae bacterium]|nr:potassium transporter TrkG [Burkholderiaceae bacterium]